MRAVAQVCKVQVRERRRWMFVSFSAHDGDHVAGVRDSWNRVEKCRIYPTEDSEVRGDAQSQRAYGERGESRILAELPQRVQQVAQQILERHRHASASASSFLSSFSETTFPSNRCTSRPAWRAKRGSCV